MRRTQTRHWGSLADAANTRPNQRWPLDFVHDQMADGRRLRILAVVDDYTHECLALVADTSISGIRVVGELDKIVAVRGRPRGIVSETPVRHPPYTRFEVRSCLRLFGVPPDPRPPDFGFRLAQL